MVSSHDKQIRRNLQQLLSTYKATIALLEEGISLLQSQYAEPARANFHAIKLRSKASAERDLPIVDKNILCVRFHGRKCFLGNTLMLRFLERLASCPNQYIDYRTLLKEVWTSQREPSTVRSVVKQLRIRLRAADMKDLADAIEGHSGHYGLMLEKHR